MNETLGDKKQQLIHFLNELEALWNKRDQRLPPIVWIDEDPAFAGIACETPEEGLLISLSGDTVEGVFGPPTDPKDVAVYAVGFPEMYEKIECVTTSHTTVQTDQ